MKDMCEEVKKLGKGIGNTCRYRILESLMEGEKTVGEIVDAVKQSQPAVSQHLATLKSCGLVQSEKRGQEVIYSIDVKQALGLLKILSAAFSKPKVATEKEVIKNN